jgi:hypothetical protein
MSSKAAERRSNPAVRASCRALEGNFTRKMSSWSDEVHARPELSTTDPSSCYGIVTGDKLLLHYINSLLTALNCWFFLRRLWYDVSIHAMANYSFGINRDEDLQRKDIVRVHPTMSC